MGQGGPSDPTAGAGVLAAGPSVPGVPERALNVAQIHGSKVPGLRFLLPGSQGTKIHCIRRESSVRPMDPVPSDDGRAQDPGYLRDQEGHRGPKDPKEPEKMGQDNMYKVAAPGLKCTVPGCATGKDAVHMLLTDLPIGVAGSHLCPWHSPFDVKPRTDMDTWDEVARIIEKREASPEAMARKARQRREDHGEIIRLVAAFILWAASLVSLALGIQRLIDWAQVPHSVSWPLALAACGFAAVRFLVPRKR